MASAKLPMLSGAPVEVRIRPSLGPHLAATFIRRRVILLDSEVLAQRGDVQRGDFERILLHELFHFAWVRLSNAARRTWERTLERELRQSARGELGWSAERRKMKLSVRDARARTRQWRLYACESFCDTAAWLFAGLKKHPEFTLAQRFRHARMAWFEEHIERGPLLI